MVLLWRFTITKSVASTISKLMKYAICIDHHGFRLYNSCHLHTKRLVCMILSGLLINNYGNRFIRKPNRFLSLLFPTQMLEIILCDKMYFQTFLMDKKFWAVVNNIIFILNACLNCSSYIGRVSGLRLPVSCITLH